MGSSFNAQTWGMNPQALWKSLCAPVKHWVSEYPCAEMKEPSVLRAWCNVPTVTCSSIARRARMSMPRNCSGLIASVIMLRWDISPDRQIDLLCAR